MGRTPLALVVALLLLPATAAAQPCPIPLPVPQCQPEPEPTPEPPPDPPPARPQAPPPEPVSSVEGSSTFGVDAGHTGYFADTKLVTPLERRWRRKLPAAAQPPLYGQGRVYVGTAGSLRALDPRTGRDLWQIAFSGHLAAYDAGRLFTLETGDLRARSPADGSILWSLPVSGYHDNRGAVASGGTVYVAGEYAGVIAVDAATGAERWRVRTESGLSGVEMPAIDEMGVYSSYGCDYAWLRGDGTGRWSTPRPCSGGGLTPVVYRGRVYSQSKVLDAATGETVGTYEGHRPLFAGDVGVFTSPDATRLRGVNLGDGRELWSVRGPQGSSWGERLIVGSTVYATARNQIAGIDLRTGARMWRAELPGEGTLLAAAPGLLLTATGGTATQASVIGWASVFDPGPDEIQIGPRRGSVLSGQRAFVGGIAGTKLRAGRVTLEYDDAPYGRWRRATRGTPADDGWVGFRLRVDRNTRLRVRAGRRSSNVVTFYAYPRVKYAFAAAGRQVRTTAKLRVPRGMRLAGRRAVLYLGRREFKRHQRLATAVLRGSGRTARAVFLHPPPQGVSEIDFVAVCIPGQARLGLGQNVGLLRRCGRRSVRF